MGKKGAKVGRVQMLLEYGADTNVKSKSGYTALHYLWFTSSSAQVYWRQMLELLLENGARLDIGDKYGRKVMDLFKKYDSQPRCRMITEFIEEYRKRAAERREALLAALDKLGMAMLIRIVSGYA